MQIRLATAAGQPGTPNEDRVLADPGLFVILDGLTARTDTGCLHGVAWFADQLIAKIAELSPLPPKQALGRAIEHVADMHVDTCDLKHPATPCAAVGIVQIQDRQLHYLTLGDITLVFDRGEDELVVTDRRIERTAIAERAFADSLPSGSHEKATALVKMKHAELAARNTESGYWIAGSDPRAAEHALIGEIESSDVRRLAMLTDGAARAVDMFGILNWSEVLNILSVEGPGELIGQVRQVEDSDSSATVWPRNKKSDDASVIFVNLG